MPLNPTEFFAKVQARLDQVNPEDRKAVAVFQVISGDLKWVLDLQDLKVYEGEAAKVDATITAEIPLFVKVLKKEITLEEAKGQGLVVEGDVELVLKATTA